MADIVKVFIADPEPEARGRLREALERVSELRVVGEAAPDELGVARVIAVEPDVLVANVSDGDVGILTCRDIRAELPDVRCVVVTSHGDDEGLVNAILVGATAYVTAEAGSDALVDAVLAAARHEDAITAAIEERLGRELEVGEDPLEGLTQQQRRVAELVAAGLTNAEIADQLDLSANTVRNYLSRVMAKLGSRNRVEVATTVALLAAERRGTLSRR